MDQQLKGVVGRGSASWDEWVVSRGSAAGMNGSLGRGHGLLQSCLGFKSALVMIFFYRCGFVFVCVFVCGLC